MIFVRGWRKMDGDHERKSCLQSRLPNFIQTARTLTQTTQLRAPNLGHHCPSLDKNFSCMT